MAALLNDIRYALRQLRKSPGFTVVTVLSLAIGIGANTAIFSAINGVLLKSLPVRDPQELRVLGWAGSDVSNVGTTSDSLGRTESGQLYRSVFPYPLYLDFAKNAKGLTDLFAFSYLEEGMTIRAHGVAAVAHGLMVSGNFFNAYGARVLIGQPVTPEDDRADAGPIAVITYRFWQKYYACDPSVLGQTLMINHVPFTIVGVLPKYHKGPLSGDPSDFYVPIATLPQLAPGDSDMLTGSDRWSVRIMGRLKSGASEAQAATSLAVLFEGFLNTADARIREPKIVLEKGRRGLGMLYGQITSVFIVLQALVGLILVIACANVASLVLARGAARQHEMSVRAAIGAGRWRLIRLSLVESLILSLAAGGVGLAINRVNRAAIAGFLARSLARTQMHLSYVSDHEGIGIHVDQGTDGTVLAFVLGVALLTTFAFGLIPALRAGHASPSEGLKDSSSVAPRLRLGKGLIAVQAGLSILLVVVAGLLTQSVANLHKADPGYDAENCLTFNLNLLDSTPGADDAGEFFDRVRTSIAAIPGVRAVAHSAPGLPGAGWYADVSIPGRPDEEFTMPQYNICDGWLDTMGIALLSGRDFNHTDTRRSPRVVIVNEAFVREYFAGRNPIGMPVTSNDNAYHIVGICGNHKTDVRDDARPIIYFPYSRWPHRHVTFTVRSVLPPLSLVAAVRRAVAEHSPDLPLEGVATQKQLLAKDIVMERFFALLCGSLALLALLLSCIGIFGLTAYNVTRRTGEIGIRMALGARPGDVAWPVLRQALALTGIGIAVGLPLTLVATRIVRGLIFGITPHDPLTIVGAVAVLLGVAVLAAWIPARRAARIDPMEALRYE
jgi:predicted permease